MSHTPLSRCLHAAGSQTRLAEIVGVTQAAISRRLRDTDGDIPWQWALDVERATGVSRRDLLPELFDAPAT